jgi:YidC/Oxa1 family membrane protein insertase
VEPQGLDRNALIGILLMSLLVGIWMIYSAPSPEDVARQQAAQDSVAAVQAARADDATADDATADDATADDVGKTAADEAVADDEALEAPADSLFATGGPAREVVVLTDHVVATFSTAGGTPTSLRLRDYDHAETETPVELVSDPRGALAIGLTPERGAYLDTRTLDFRPSVAGETFGGDTLRVGEQPVELAFETPAPGRDGAPGALRLVYTFAPDSYDVDLRVEAPGTSLLDGGYELVWHGEIPLAENDVKAETMQAGAYLRLGDETDVLHLKEPGTPEAITRTGTVDWAAVKTKFFLAALIPSDATPTEGAELSGTQTGEVGTADFGQHFTARVETAGLTAGQSHDYTLYLGPLELRRLAPFGLYDTVDFGFGQSITRPLARYVIAPTLALFTGLLPNFGLAIILFGLLVKLVLWPLTSASYRSAAKMRELQPQMALVKEKYGDDPQKQQEATMRMYREAGVNPLGGCLPMLLQYPILIALWRFFQSTLVLRGESFLWAADLSAPDPVIHFPFAIPIIGSFLSGFTILMALSMLVSMRLSQGGGAAMPSQQKVLLYLMPLMFFFFFNNFPSGLSLYYLAFNLFSIVQQQMINKQVHAQHEAGETPEIDRAAATVETQNGKAGGQAKQPAGKRARGGFTTDVVSGARKPRRP